MFENIFFKIYILKNGLQFLYNIIIITLLFLLYNIIHITLIYHLIYTDLR